MKKKKIQLTELRIYTSCILFPFALYNEALFAQEQRNVKPKWKKRKKYKKTNRTNKIPNKTCFCGFRNGSEWNDSCTIFFHMHSFLLHIHSYRLECWVLNTANCWLFSTKDLCFFFIYIYIYFSFVYLCTKKKHFWSVSTFWDQIDVSSELKLTLSYNFWVTICCHLLWVSEI